MKILITGALGVIGSQIAFEALEAGRWVRIIDAAEAPRNLWVEQELRKRWPIGPGLDIAHERLEHTHTQSLAADVKWSDQVIHAAASTGIPHSRLHPDDDWISNVDATKALLEALRVHPRPTAVLSSVKPYRVGPRQRIKEMGGLHEDVPLEPDEPYAASKAAQSMLCMAYARSYKLPVVTLRCSNLYGPAPCHGPRHGWLTWFCISAAIGRTIEVQGTGDQARDMLYATDVASACRAALEHADRLGGQVFNIGGGKENVISVRAAAAWLHGQSGVEIKSAPGRADEDDLVFANFSRFRRETGWSPKVGVEEGMVKIFTWAKDNRAALAELYKDA